MEDNWFIASLSAECRDFLSQRLVGKNLMAGEVLYEAGEPIQSLIFPVDGIISLQTEIGGGRRVENLTVGRDGVMCAQVMLGDTHQANTAVALLAGRALWLSTADFFEALHRYPCVRPAVMACMARVVRRLMQSVACLNVHNASQRIATWLLHLDDRYSSGSFDLTQRTLSETLALRPATVSDSCSNLLAAKAIHYNRGRISILDRERLKERACECYGAVSLETLRSVGDIHLRF